MNRIGGNGDFVDAGFFRARIDIDFGRRLGIRTVRLVVVVFDVIARYLQVANFTFFNSNPAETVVTDMVAGDVDLVQVNLIEKNPYATVVVDMAVTDQHVSISLKQANAVSDLVNEHSLKNGLHRLD